MQRLSLLGVGITAGVVLGAQFIGVQNATAVGICKCDSDKGFETSCLAVCKEANEKTSFFRPAVYFGNDPKVNSDKTPFNGTSLKFLYMSHPTRMGMESFRQFLEQNRNSAEAEFKKIRKAYLKGHVGPEEFSEAEKMRDEAVVNYQHGMRAYLNTPTPR